jgi:hypothetical protein
VYFVQRTTDGAVKIGTSVDPRARLMALRTASADELVLVAVTSGGHKLERQLHLRFSIQRLNGEWFRPSDELRSLIESLEKKAA